MKIRNYLLLLFLAAMLHVSFTADAQVTIGSGDAPQEFSVLELISNQAGLRLPQVKSTEERDRLITNSEGFRTNYAARGLMIFNMETQCVETWNGTEWILLCLPPPPGPPGIGPPAGTTDPGVVINGIRWAMRNVYNPGTFAVAPQDPGRLFQWGTIDGTTHHWPATGATVTGWNTSTGRVAWTAENDPCPAGWRVPTRQELLVLYNTNSDWHSNWNGTGVAGRVFPAGAMPEEITGTSPTAIFLPAVGHRENTDGRLFLRNMEGEYWSSTLEPTHPLAFRLIFRTNSTNSLRVIAGSVVNAYSIRCVAVMPSAD